MLDEPRRALRWLLAYVGLVVLSGFLRPMFPPRAPWLFAWEFNSGPPAAGVIGRKKFVYEVWGDAVNPASRMERHGSRGVIQITCNTYEIIKDDFICEPRGMITVKGKGEMEVWYVLGASDNKAWIASIIF